MRLLVTGATGRTGQEIVRQAQAAGYEVVAIARSRETAAPLLPGAKLVVGNALDPAFVTRAIEGCDAVISALGTRKVTFFKKVTVNSEATRALVSAMKARSVSRLVCITGLGAGDSVGHGGFLYDRIIRAIIIRTIYQDKDRQEAVVRASGLDWVIVRPSVLTDKPASGRIRAFTDLTGFRGGTVSRADVAAFLIDQLASDKWLHKAPLITGDK